MIAGARLFQLDASLDGARILYRHCLSTNPPKEGWVREFSPKGDYVRISRTPALTDAGTWHDCYQLRIEGILEPAKAPKAEEHA